MRDVEGIERSLARLRFGTRIIGFVIFGLFSVSALEFVCVAHEIHEGNQLRKSAPGIVGFPNHVVAFPQQN